MSPSPSRELVGWPSKPLSWQLYLRAWFIHTRKPKLTLLHRKLSYAIAELSCLRRKSCRAICCSGVASRHTTSQQSIGHSSHRPSVPRHPIGRPLPQPGSRQTIGSLALADANESAAIQKRAIMPSLAKITSAI